ncbi:MAG: hypothetical protein HZC51_12905 [Nitrospirae bacterium]|nr:hypothetical protein [Nitrospirota bacterium]
MSKRREISDNQLEFDLEATLADIREARCPKKGPKSLPYGALNMAPQVAAALHGALQKARGMTSPATMSRTRCRTW